MILSFDEAGDLLDQMAEEFPEEFYQELNGGISLLPEAREDPEGEDLYIMGEYCNDMMGKYINLYYGSFAALAEQEDWTEEDWEDELYTTLSHEFTHHIEGLAGERGLEIKDATPAVRGSSNSKGADAMRPPLPFLFFFVPRHHGEEDQVLRAVVDEGVGMAFRAVVAIAGRQGLLPAVVQDLARAGQDIHHLAAAHMGMQPDRGARRQPAVHDAGLVVVAQLGIGDLFAPLELGDLLFHHLRKIDFHSSFLLTEPHRIVPTDPGGPPGSHPGQSRLSSLSRA